MQPETGFNAVAATYDEDFTGSITGTLQRRRVWHYLDKYIRSPLTILEINCGTGTDALMLAGLGHQVTATDIAAEMIGVCMQKPNPDNVTFSVCGFEALHVNYAAGRYDMVFSNFAGLNCVNAETLKRLNKDFSRLLAPKGKLVMVLLGKKCWIERTFFTLKGEHRKAGRRAREATAQLNSYATQQTFCYAASEVKALFDQFVLVEKKPVGLFVPPSYLEPFVKRNAFLLPFVKGAEWLAGGLSWWSDYADHTFIVMEKK